MLQTVKPNLFKLEHTRTITKNEMFKLEVIIGIKYKKDFLNAYKVLALLEVRNSELFAWLRPNLTPWSHHDFERIKKFREDLLRRLPRSCTHLREKLHKKNSLSGGYRQPFQTGKIQKVALII